MKNLVKMAAISTIVAAAGVANAGLVTFDNVTSASIGTIPNGYEGLDWSSFGVIRRDLFPNSGYANGVVSGDYAAFNEFASVAMASGSAFTFNSAYLTGAWNNGLNVLVEGLLNNSVVYSQTVVVNTSGPTLFQFNFSNIDRLRFTSFGGTDAGLGGGGTHFVMDNMLLNSVIIPLPTGAAMGMAGMGLLAIRRRGVR